MNFTFGIITKHSPDLEKIIESIERQNIPSYEIIVVGGNPIERKNLIHVPFEEHHKSNWITRKKNLITQHSHYENIVYLHDYVYLDDDWYEGFLKFGDDFKVCMNVIRNLDGKRYRDWCLEFMIQAILPDIKFDFLLPYDLTHLSRYMYISGAYWVTKRDVMMEFPLNERLCWGDSEDIEWSMRVRRKYPFSMNPYSTVRLTKQKDRVFGEPSKEIVEKLKNLK